ncbi:low temperature requirement protein A [Actinopolymorpha sp. B17G11]|uniref:low temperature requirement protein A n=1 Tax=Actinopolymorpha sp. B17G11 TaxID=3160861 RepID=UPI0032E4D647
MTERVDGVTATRWRRRLSSRDMTEAHRSATPLELLFDLCFVVAVAQAAAHLHHAVSAGHVAGGVLGYLTVFFAIWWAWVNFTWFASAYDNDDVPYRLATMVEIAGTLVIAAGVPRAFDSRDFGIIVLGYAIMRIALVAQWLRAAFANPAGRATAIRFVIGLTVCMLGWTVLFIEGSWPLWGWGILVVAEVCVPVWAERAGRTAWHRYHIAERYGLFTIIVLGESVLAATIAVQTALDENRASAALYEVVLGGLLIVFAMWWLYFAKPAARFLDTNRAAFVWSYGHYLIFAAAAAVGAGLSVVIDQQTDHGELGRTGAGAAVTVPVAVYLLTLWFLHVRPHGVRAARTVLYPVTAVLVLATTWTGVPVLLSGLLLTGLAAVTFVIATRDNSSGDRLEDQPAGR